MAQRDSTRIPEKGKFFFRDSEAREYALYLDGQPVGWAKTADEAEATLDRLAYDQLNHNSGWAVAPPPSQPLPPMAAVVETLDELAAIPSDTAHLFIQARAHLNARLPVVVCLATYWIGCVAVSAAPANTGWPWRCACARERCWHSALAEALSVAADHHILDLAA